MAQGYSLVRLSPHVGSMVDTRHCRALGESVGLLAFIEIAHIHTVVEMMHSN